MSSDGPRWLLLHGTPLDGAIWREVIGELGEVLAPDLAVPAGAPNIQAMAASHLLKTLDDDGRTLDVVGHSFGGQIALEMALAAPERIRSLVILCSRDTPFPSFASTAAGIRSGAPIDVEAALHRWFRPHELAADGAAVRHARACLMRADPSAYARALDAIASFDRSMQRDRIQVPATLIAAELDPVSTPAVMADWSRALPRARHRMLPDAAHMSLFARPGELVSVLMEHVRWRYP